jgi:arsenite transporter
MINKDLKRIGFFEKYLTLWVALCIIAGIVTGNISGSSVQVLSRLEIFNVNIPVAILIWFMIYPMMLPLPLPCFACNHPPPW